MVAYKLHKAAVLTPWNVVHDAYTVIHKNLVVKNFVLCKHEIFLLVILFKANIWHTFDMNENIVTQKFLP